MPVLQSKAVHGAVQDLRRRISDGTYASGQQIPPERVLSEDYGIARNTLRQALRALEEEGLLVRHVGKGTFVNPESARQSDGLMSRLKEASPDDVMEVRLIFEPRAAALAAVRANDTDLDAIDEALRNSVNATGIAQFEHWDAALHLGIVAAAKNTLLMEYCRAINEIRNQPGWYQLKKHAMTSGQRSKYHQQHTAIVNGLKDRDGKLAAQHMREHIASVRDSLLGSEDDEDL